MQSDSARLKVCYIITKGVWGGAQKYVYTLATSLPAQAGLPKDAYDVLVITGEGHILKNKLEQAGIRVIEITSLKRDLSVVAEIKSFFLLLKIIWKEKPDVLHLNSPKASGIGSVVGRFRGTKKIIQTIHGWTFNENRGFFAGMAIYFFSWLTLVLCHTTITIAKKETSQALEMPLLNKSKVVTIKNGVPEIVFKEKEMARQEILARTGKPGIENALWLGTISELHENKGLAYTIAALTKIQTPFIFFILGEGEERKNLERLIKAYNLETKVFILGFVDGANTLLKAFDIFTLSSIKEGLPYAILEAGLASLPVIASSVGGIPEIIENNKSGILVTKTKSGEITRAIEYLIQNPNKGIGYGQNLKTKVETEFSVYQMLEKTFSLYN